MSRTLNDEYEQIFVVEANRRLDSGQFVTSINHPAKLRVPSEYNVVLTRLIILVGDVHTAPVDDAFDSRTEGLS